MRERTRRSIVRVLALSVALCLALCGAPAARAITAQSTLETELDAYRRELQELRAGDENVLPRLRQRAERLAREFARPDTADVLEYYARLPQAARTRGLEAEREYARIFDAVRDARDIAVDEWQELRAELLPQLNTLVARTRDEADFAPAGRALALIAVLHEQRARHDPELDEQEREALCEDAKRAAQESLLLFERAKMVTPRLEPMWILARVDHARGRSQAARAEFEAVHALASTIGRDDYRARALDGLLELSDEAGDLHESRRLLHELAGLRSPSEDWSLAARHAEYLLECDRAEAAREFLERNPPAAEDERRAWHLLLGGALLRGGDANAARAHYQQAREGVAAVEAASRTAPPSEADIGEAELLIAEGELERGRALLGDPDTFARLGTSARGCALRALGTLELRSNRLVEAERAFVQALELGLELEARLERTSGTSVFGERIGLETVARLAETRLRAGDALGAALAIEMTQSRGLRGTSELTRADLQRWARAAELGLVTWVIGADSSVVAHVAPDGSARARVIPIGRRRLEEGVRRLREGAIRGETESARKLAQEIEAVVFPGAIAQALKHAAGDAGEDARSVLCLVHGPLERLPLDLLPLFSASQVTNLVPLCLPGLPSAAPAEADAARFDRASAWHLLGAPLAANGESELPGAAAELGDIAALLEHETEASGAAFVRAAMSSALTSGQPVHIATHLRPGCGEQAASRGEGGLLLSGGDVFCAGDIEALRAAPPLVVLAACETAEGRFVDAEGLQSVARAFLASGTRSLVVTLWPIEDEAARKFGVAFHAALASGLSPSLAARRARAELAAAGTSSADWAAFRFLGSD